jgi:hypothetical protein
MQSLLTRELILLWDHIQFRKGLRIDIYGLIFLEIGVGSYMKR